MPNADVILEIPESWFENPLDGERHQRFYASILVALARLSVTVRPLLLPFGADDAERLHNSNQLVISYHSRGDYGNVIRFKESYVHPYYTLDTLGYSGFSELAKNPEAFAKKIAAFPLSEARKIVHEVKKSLIEKNLSKYPQPKDKLKQLPSRYVFLPLQTEDDPVAMLGFLDQLDVARNLAELCTMLNMDVLVKRHPFCRSLRVENALSNLQRTYANFQIVDGSIHELNQNATCVIGCNSGVLFEALILGARVISFGRSDFSIATTPVSRLDDLPNSMIDDGSYDHNFRLKFLGWYLSVYCVSSFDVDEIEYRFKSALEQIGISTISQRSEQQNLYELHSKSELKRRHLILSKKDLPEQ